MRLKRHLGLLDIFSISSGAMISSGLFILLGLAFTKTGPSLILSYLLASLLIIPVLLSKAELATAMPRTGGSFFYVHRSMGAGASTPAGFAAWFSLAFKSVFALIGIGAILLLFFPGITMMQIKLVAAVFCIIFTLVNLIGVRHVGRVQTAIVVCLISLLVFYIIFGSFSVQSHRYAPFMPLGLGSVFATAGFIFISYGGLTKVCAVAGEVKKPKRNIPLGMFLSWGIVSLLYVLVAFVTIGLLNPGSLQNSLTPISDGARIFMGGIGAFIMGIAAVLAFGSTANAGILSASRTSMAMSKDKLLPRPFKKVSKRGVPRFSILSTSAVMIFFILFLDLENLVKTASTLKLLLFLLATLSLIVMRESKARHYRPTFRAPLYPWIQIFGIIGYAFLIFEMGIVSMLTVSILVICGLGWYWVYARGKVKREHALLHVVKRVRKK